MHWRYADVLDLPAVVYELLVEDLNREAADVKAAAQK